MKGLVGLTGLRVYRVYVFQRVYRVVAARIFGVSSFFVGLRLREVDGRKLYAPSRPPSPTPKCSKSP